MARISSSDLIQEALLLEALARKLREAARLSEQYNKVPQGTPNSGEAPSQASLPLNVVPVEGKKSREIQLADFLKSSGPMSFTDLITQSGIPRGTLVTLLGKSKLIEKDSEGRWIPKPNHK